MLSLLNGELILRTLEGEDGAALSDYFAGLGPETLRRFQPHSLTTAMAHQICGSPDTRQSRFVVEREGRIIAYFILDREMSIHETNRYREHGIMLESGLDFLFAPSVTDEFQGKGIASLAMPRLLSWARSAGARSLVLMGGTQATNARAIAFYEKFGFQRFGGYQTEIFNHDMRLCLPPGAGSNPPH